MDSQITLDKNKYISYNKYQIWFNKEYKNTKVKNEYKLWSLSSFSQIFSKCLFDKFSIKKKNVSDLRTRKKMT